jgi:hypothetical protein
MLLATWFTMVARWRSAFAQDRSFQRFLLVLLGLMATRGRGTLTSALGFFGQILRWSSDYRAFSRSNWDERALFRGVLAECAPYLHSEPRIVLSLDDTGLPKTSRKIKQVSWLRDPMGPKFKPNLIRGIRCLHAAIHIPPQREGLGATGVSVGFELAPPPKKPKASADEDAWKDYQSAQKTHCLTARGAALVHTLRKDCDDAGLCQLILCVVDGGYTNQRMLVNLPDRVDLIGRVRKDIRICMPAKEQGRKVYGEAIPTPEELLKDGCLMIQTCSSFYGQRKRSVQFKEMNGILWPNGAKRRLMRIIIVIPTPYRPQGCRKLRYAEPAYLITTDLLTPAEVLIQQYFDRWEIEILHRDLKTHVGLGDAQVWSEKSVTRVHPALVAAFAMLKLASMKAFGPTRTVDYHDLPRWRSRKDRTGLRKPSAHDLLTRLRSDLSANIQETPLHPREIHAVA